MTVPAAAKALILLHPGKPTMAQRACRKAGWRLTYDQVRNVLDAARKKPAK